MLCPACDHHLTWLCLLKNHLTHENQDYQCCGKRKLDDKVCLYAPVKLILADGTIIRAVCRTHLILHRWRAVEGREQAQRALEILASECREDGFHLSERTSMLFSGFEELQQRKD